MSKLGYALGIVIVVVLLFSTISMWRMTETLRESNSKLNSLELTPTINVTVPERQCPYHDGNTTGGTWGARAACDAWEKRAP